MIAGTRDFHCSTTCCSTLPLSALMTPVLIFWCALKRFSHPFDACWAVQQTVVSFCSIIGPETGILAERTRWNHSNVTWSISGKSDPMHIRFHWAGWLSSYAVMYSALCFKMFCTYFLPIPRSAVSDRCERPCLDLISFTLSSKLNSFRLDIVAA